jgi:hypothetical protein
MQAGREFIENPPVKHKLQIQDDKVDFYKVLITGEDSAAAD